jgi:hypothetical protein
MTATVILEPPQLFVPFDHPAIKYILLLLLSIKKAKIKA